MLEFLVIQRNFGYIDPSQQFKFYKIKAIDREKAEEKSANRLCNSDSQEWLLSKEELSALKNTLNSPMEHIQEIQQLKNKLKETHICCINYANKLNMVKDKLHRRNMQIKNLQTQLEQIKITAYDKYGMTSKDL